MKPTSRLVSIIPLLVGACSPTPSAALPTPLASSPSSIASPSAPPSASASGGPSARPTAWREAFSSDNVRLGNVIAGPDGFIAAGCITDEDLNCKRRIVVRSPDGESWTVIDVAVAADLGPSSLHLVDDRFFSVGYGYDGDGGGGAVVWTSPDGSSWTDIRAGSFRNRAIDDIIESAFGTFAVGDEAPIDSDNTSGFVMWPVRGDGTFGKARVVDTGGDPHLVSGALWAGKEFLAWGLRNGPWAGPVVLLASRDGRAWTRRATIPGPDVSVSEIIAVADRLIAVGYEGRRYPLTPRAWVSEDDGRSWNPATVEDTDAMMRTVERRDGRIVVRGIESSGSESRPVSWISADGTVWNRLPDDEDMPAVHGFSAVTRASIGDRICVAGSFYDDATPRTAIYCR